MAKTQKDRNGKDVPTNTEAFGCVTIDVSKDQKKTPAKRPVFSPKGDE